MSTFRSIEDIEVWKDGCELAIKICKFTSRKEFNQFFRLKDQLQGSVISIPSNIAESFESQSEKEFIKFLYYSKRSAGELRTQLYIAEELNLFSNKEFRELAGKTVLISKKISKLINYLKTF